VTPEERRVVDGSTWRDFCRDLEAAGQVVFSDRTPVSPLDRAEGLRYLTRLLRAGLDSFVESSDPCHPRFFQLSNETIKIGNDNPDNIYHNARVSSAYEYRIVGKRGTVPYLTFGSKGGGYESDGTMTPTGQLNLENMEFAPDGSFEISVARERKSGNWLPLEDASNAIIVRQTFEHREREEPASYRIECLNPDAGDSLRPEAIGPALKSATDFVGMTASLFVDWMGKFEMHTNALPPNDQEMCHRAGGDANIYYHNSRWRLAPNEALVIEATPPECATWNLQIGNFWMESLDYRYHRVHLNKFTADVASDGSVKIVLAHRDPGSSWPNWLETCDHSEGAMLFRYVGAKEYPAIRTEVVRFEDLEGR